jgi:ankyrin repeat protein
MIEFLLDEGADIDAIDDDGRTPIQYAANDGQGSIFDLLVDRGAKWDIKDNFGVAAVKGLAQRNSPKIRKRIEQGGYGGHGGIF